MLEVVLPADLPLRRRAACSHPHLLVLSWTLRPIASSGSSRRSRISQVGEETARVSLEYHSPELRRMTKIRTVHRRRFLVQRPHLVTPATTNVLACFLCPKPALEGTVLLALVANSTNGHLGGDVMKNLYSLYSRRHTRVILSPRADMQRSASRTVPSFPRSLFT